MAGTEDNEWELSKENIQPLKKGRRISSLMAALDETKHAELNKQKMEFEKQIRTYSGEDPLQVWYQYVLWMEQNYPNGGMEGNCMKLIEHCFQFIEKTCGIDKYKNDFRFLGLWIKYADQYPKPMEVYEMIYDQNIGIKYPVMYVNWAYQHEIYENYKKASDIYAKGLQQQDLEDRQQLETSYKHFQMRVAKQSIQNSQDDNPPPEDSRELGNRLRHVDAKKRVLAPVERVGFNVVGEAGFVLTDKTDNATRPKFEVYQDENNLQTQTKTETPFRVPSFDSKGQENVGKPTKWNKAKSKPKESIPVSSLPNINCLNFPVYVDPEVDKNQCRMKPIASRALSEKKVADWKVPLFTEQTEEKTKSMYPKSRVYCGNEEFSLEEIRAIDYFKKNEISEENNDKCANIPEGSCEKLNDLAVVKHNSACIASIYYNSQSTQIIEQPQYCKNKVYCNNEEFSLEEIRAQIYFEEEKKKEEDMKVKDEINNLKTMLQQQQVLINKLMEDKSDNSSSVKSFEIFHEKSIIKQKPAYEDSWIVINKSVTEPNKTNILDESTKGLLVAASELTQLPELKLETTVTTFVTPMRVQKERQSHISMRDIQPSPTINTKFANQVLSGLFNTTLSNSVYGKETEQEQPYAVEEPFEIYQDNQPPKAESVPFTIYQDENLNSNKKPFQKMARLPFAALSDISSKPSSTEPSPVKSDDDDKENKGIACGLSAKRSLSGVLVPSRDILVEEPEEELAVPLEDEDDKFTKPSIPEDYTIKLPSGENDFAKMAPIASTPNPWSYGIVPQKDMDDDFTMKAPKIFVTEPSKSEIGIKMSNLKIHPPCISVNQSSKFGNESPKPLLSSGTKESSKIFSSSKNIIKTDFTLNSNFNKTETIEECNNLPKSETEKMKNVFNAEKVTAMILNNRVSLFSKTVKTTKISHDHLAKENKFNMPEAPEDFTIRLPSSQNDFAKMAAIASTPNQWSLGLLPQKDMDDDFTMKAPAITLSSLPTNRIISDSVVDIKPIMSEIPIDHDKLTNDENNKENSFNADMVAAMIWNDMDPIFNEKEIAEISNVQQHEKCLNNIEIPYPDIIDPFCNDLKKVLVFNLKEPIQNRSGFIQMYSAFPKIKSNSQLILNEETYRIRYLKGKGNYAQIYQAFTEDSMNVTAFPADFIFENSVAQMALKVQTKPCYWEFYICHELRKRLKEKKIKFTDSFMRINKAYFYTHGSIFVTDYLPRGSLLDLINAYKMANKPIAQNIVIYIIIELLKILQALHSCDMIHADLKPDNVMIGRLPSECGFTNDPLSTDSQLMLKLIDFGRTIDLKLLPAGSTFTKKVKTDGFTCCEMTEGRPWTFQTDYYGLAATAHCLLWGSYMKVEKKENRWSLSGVTMQRYWNKELWNEFFDQLLNVESCQKLLDLTSIRDRFIAVFNAHSNPSSITDGAFVLR